MNRYTFITLICMICCTSIPGQSILHGRVVSSDTHKPIALANVFLSNTSTGTITDEKGEFTISRFPNGRYDLIVSFIGYETSTTIVQSTRLPVLLEIVLKPRVNELKEVIVEAYDKDGWDKWGNIFTDNFIGTSYFSKECTILNKDVLKFRFSKKQNILRVSADEPIIIENRALGYVLKYDLARFEFNITDRTFLYQGNPFFSEMVTDREGLKKRWIDNRRDAYYGSITHFMRSLYANRLAENKFEVRKIIKVSEEEKKRVDSLYHVFFSKKQRPRRTIDGDAKKEMVIENPDAPDLDSLDYYRRVKDKPALSFVVFDRVLTADSIAFAIDSVTVGLDREHFEVIYLPKKNLPEYQRYLPFRGSAVTSEIIPAANRMVTVLANGTYFEGADIVFSGFWAWWGKMCNKLPYDYQPPK